MVRKSFDLPRKIAWLQTKENAAWGCSKCLWFFLPIPIAVGNSFDQMTANIQEQLETEFASHDCAQHPTTKGSELDRGDRVVSILRKAPQPPLSRPGGVRDANPFLVEGQLGLGSRDRAREGGMANRNAKQNDRADSRCSGRPR
jgi:hypothetical protein